MSATFSTTVSTYASLVVEILFTMGSTYPSLVSVTFSLTLSIPAHAYPSRFFRVGVRTVLSSSTLGLMLFSYRVVTEVRILFTSSLSPTSFIFSETILTGLVVDMYSVVAYTELVNPDTKGSSMALLMHWNPSSLV